MSITTTLNNALSGLNAASRRAEIVSANVANANTDGYSRRVLDTSAASVAGMGAGVRIEGISRITDLATVQDRRLAASGLGNGDTLSAYYSSVENAIGIPDQSGSLNDRVARLEAALISAGSRPDSEPRLQNVITEARGLADHLGVVSSQVQELREKADSTIASQVEDLNNAMQQVRDLNIAIGSSKARGQDASGLLDQRQQVIDRISSIVPVRQVPRDNGAIALFTSGGAILVDGLAATIEFTPTGTITPDMAVGGALSGLTMNGVAIDTSSAGSTLSGGSLIANFSIRDELAVESQAQVDAVARNLVERFQTPLADPTLNPGDAGLFTDAGAAFNILNEEGLSGRLRINALADPAQGGEVRRLRDGLGAATAGDVGDATQIQRLADALQAPQPVVSGGFSGTARTLTTLATDLLSGVGTARQSMEANVAYFAVKMETLQSTELESGVDTDKEMQDLLLVEQAFAANARVMQTADELIQLIVGL